MSGDAAATVRLHSTPLHFVSVAAQRNSLLPFIRMRYRNLSGYFKPEPHAVWVAVVVVLTIGVNVFLQFAGALLPAAGNFPQ